MLVGVSDNDKCPRHSVVQCVQNGWPLLLRQMCSNVIKPAKYFKVAFQGSQTFFKKKWQLKKKFEPFGEGRQRKRGSTLLSEVKEYFGIALMSCCATLLKSWL
jgi:hypothetical protein